MRITVYLGNGEYVDTIEVEDDASDSDISEVATQAALEYVENSLYWEPEED